jgi:hypothetical protein
MGLMVARRSIVAAVASLCALCALAALGAPAALAVEPPVIEDESVLDAAGTSATLQATINPKGSETTYRFEYGTSEAYGAQAPIPDGFVGANSAGVTVSAEMQGLAPATTYHYRVVAVVAARGESVSSADHTFTTQPSGSELALLDGRQWELVSPSNKHGATILPIGEVGVIQAAADGHAISYYANAPTELEPGGYSNAVQALSIRGPREWASQDIATPHNAATGVSVGQGYEYRFFSSDLSLAMVEPQGPFTPLSTEATERTPYIRDNANCVPSPPTCYMPLVTAGNVTSGAEFGGNPSYLKGAAQFVGATSDLSHVVLSSFEVGLTSTPGDMGGLYEWSDGKLRLVSIKPASEGGGPVSYLAGREPPVLGSSDQHNARRAISANGALVFWSDAFGENQLYVRDMVKGETLRIGTGRAEFQIATSNGSRIFYIEASNLYACDLSEVAGKLACDATQLATEVQGTIMGASEDGSYVYFVSTATMATGALAGDDNLYVEHYNGTAWEAPNSIAVLSGEDFPDWLGSLNDLTGRVSANGRWLAFMSQRSLTGYDTRDAVSGQPDEEVYLYHASTRKLVCASCDPTGARPNGSMYGEGVYGKSGLLGGGDRVWGQERWLAANIPGWTPYELGRALYQSRYLSNEGRLFFNSGDALVPQDVNGTWDVYEYEPPGVGSCGTSGATFTARSEGCIDLVSSGGSADQSAFMDASENGNDVFFLTTSHLSARDIDTSFDIYDAHVCSPGAPCVSSPVSPPACTTGDSCKAAPSPQPSVFGAPPSATFAGIGNVTESSAGAVRPRSLTRAQKLRRALRACRKKRSRHRRIVCKRRARKLYGVKKATRGSR